MADGTLLYKSLPQTIGKIAGTEGVRYNVCVPCITYTARAHAHKHVLYGLLLYACMHVLVSACEFFLSYNTTQHAPV